MNRFVFKSAFLILASVSIAYAGPYEKPPYGPGQVRVGEDKQRDEDFKEIRIDEKLGAQLPISDITFLDDTGASRAFSQYFGKRPVVLSLVYFRCPSLCGLLMNGVIDSLKRIPLEIGSDYDAIFVSINPEETPQLAHEKRENYLKDYLIASSNREKIASGFHFLTGTQENIQKLARAVGFGYRKDEVSGEYNHSAGFFVLTPKGILSRVHFGVQFEPRDVKLSIVEASHGEVGSIVDKIMLFCYRYDPNSKGYALAAMNLMRFGGAVTLALMFFYLGLFWFKQRRLMRQSRN